MIMFGRGITENLGARLFTGVVGSSVICDVLSEKSKLEDRQSMESYFSQ